MAALQTDRSYTSFSRHLRQPSKAILVQLDCFQPPIVYHFAYGKKGQPNGQNPAPLTAAIVGGSAFRFTD